LIIMIDFTLINKSKLGLGVLEIKPVVSVEGPC